MPQYYRHIISEGAEYLYPLFVLFDCTEARIKQGLTGAHLPFVIIPSQQQNSATSTLLDRGTEVSDR
jgi:hypothetical protein